MKGFSNRSAIKVHCMCINGTNFQYMCSDFIYVEYVWNDVIINERPITINICAMILTRSNTCTVTLLRSNISAVISLSSNICTVTSLICNIYEVTLQGCNTGAVTSLRFSTVYVQ